MELEKCPLMYATTWQTTAMNNKKHLRKVKSCVWKMKKMGKDILVCFGVGKYLGGTLGVYLRGLIRVFKAKLT